MAQAGTLSITFDASPTRVRSQTPDSMVAPDSQTPRTQLTAIVAPYLDGMEFPEYEVKFHALTRHALMILPIEAERVRRFVKGLVIPIRLGVSQVVASGVAFQKMKREGKKADHSSDYGGAPPKSRGYSGRGDHSQSSRPIHASIPAFEADYAGHSSSISVHTSQGSSSRTVGRGVHSGH
ncbi:hypothetical protein H5410_027555 [Solanum commersonii]|uniref:Uncharacterized protein n=1 Tax=Solanum commersonii TaxID=4109 RepID=A0A9J5Z2C7_SOLCO|nr:hypothetical protein H5410_027555 [Solanum commersonii]